MLMVQLACFAVVGEEVTLGPVADTCLWEFDADFNFGAQTDLPAGTLAVQGDRARSRALFRFDFSSLPNISSVISAQLNVTVTRSPPAAANSTFALHRVLKPWREGTKSGEIPGGANATAGETTWNQRLHGETLWETPGGQMGIDFGAAVSGSAIIRGNGRYEFQLTTQGLADVQSMRTDPSSNYGWILITQAEGTAKTARRFGSREHASSAPELVISFAPPFTVPLVNALFDTEAEEVVITVSALASASYRLERALSESPNTWVTVAQETPMETASLPLRASTAGLEVAFFRVTGSPP